MKEIIYLDNTLVNSFLAQYNSGLINTIVSSLTTSLTETEENGKSTNYGGGAGVPGVASTEISQNIDNKFQTSYAKDNYDSQEIAFHDFALDLLLENLNEIQESNIEFSTAEGKLRLYNFERLETIMDRSIVNIFDQDEIHNKQINSQIETIKNSSIYKSNKKHFDKKIAELKNKLKEVDESKYDNYDNVRRLGKIGNALYPNSCLVKIGKQLMVCPKENFRANEAGLALFNETDKVAKCLTLPLYTRGDGYIKKDEDGTIIQLDVEVIAASSPTMIMDILLDNFELSQKGDIVARPIAIYFE